MALQLIYGNSGSGKSTYIYEKVIQMALSYSDIDKTAAKKTAPLQ